MFVGYIIEAMQESMGTAEGRAILIKDYTEYKKEHGIQDGEVLTEAQRNELAKRATDRLMAVAKRKEQAAHAKAK